MACRRGKYSLWLQPCSADDLFLFVLFGFVFLEHLHSGIVYYNFSDAHRCFRGRQEVAAGHIGQGFVYKDRFIFKINLVLGQSQSLAATEARQQQQFDNGVKGGVGSH